MNSWAALVVAARSEWFGGDSANAAVVRAYQSIELHSQRSTTHGAQVRAIALKSLGLTMPGEQLEVGIDLGRVSNTPPPRGSLLIRLRWGTTEADVISRLREIAAAGSPAGMDVEALADDGSGLGGSN
jgi:hypothetical protein